MSKLDIPVTRGKSLPRRKQTTSDFLFKTARWRCRWYSTHLPTKTKVWKVRSWILTLSHLHSFKMSNLSFTTFFQTLQTFSNSLCYSSPCSSIRRIKFYPRSIYHYFYLALDVSLCKEARPSGKVLKSFLSVNSQSFSASFGENYQKGTWEFSLAWVEGWRKRE